MIETERRFLLKYFPKDLFKQRRVEIEDLMILTGEKHPHLRLRKVDNNFQLTRKYRRKTGSMLQMIEETITLIEMEFNILKKLPHTGQRKFRYYYPYQNLTSEIDVWQDKLDGLAIAEFEFRDVKTAQGFRIPEFSLVEVTEEEWLAGGLLSGKSYSDIEEGLKQLGYKPLTLV